MTRAALFLFVAACSGSTPTMNAPSPSANPVVRLAWIAYELDAVMKTKTPAEHAALVATTFVRLDRPIAPPVEQTPVTFIIARDATFDVYEIGRNAPPLPFTTFGADHSACVGRAERRVALKLASAAPVEGVVLEGCPPPPNAYEVVVLEGAHPSAVLVESASGRIVRLASGVELPVPEHDGT